jgi:hypothetical protein
LDAEEKVEVLESDGPNNAVDPVGGEVVIEEADQ